MFNILCYIISLGYFESFNTYFYVFEWIIRNISIRTYFLTNVIRNITTSSTWTTLYRVQSKCCRRGNTWVEMTLNQTILIGHSHFLMTHLIFIFRRKKDKESKKKKFVKWQWLRKKRIIRKANRDWDFGLNEVETKIELLDHVLWHYEIIIILFLFWKNKDMNWKRVHEF